MSIADHLPHTADAAPLVWFAMSATYGRELKAKSYLESQGVTCFVPMRYEMVSNGRLGKVRRLIPVVRNLLFAYTTKDRIQALKSSVGYLQYVTRSDNGKNLPIIVPENQMQQFIAVCETYNDALVYLTPDEVNLEKGTPVRIIGGTFDGVEGTFVKVNGKRNKRVVVLAQGVAAVMISEYSGGYLQVLE